MPSNDYIGFKKIEHYGKPNILPNIEVNLKHYFDWSFLKIGAWNNVDILSSGIYGGNFTELKNINDEGYSDNYVFGSIRKDWVYETGVDYNGSKYNVSNINLNVGQNANQVFVENHNFVSGDTVKIIDNTVYNGTFDVTGVSGDSIYINLSANSGTGLGGTINGIYNPIDPVVYIDGSPAIHNTDYTINYPLGQVVFNSAQTGTITADYSYRQVQIYLADDAPWYFELQLDSLDPSDLQWTQTANSGDFQIPTQNAIQMPCVIIEANPSRNIKPYEIGPRITNWVEQGINFYIAAETKYERDNIIDILSEQQGSFLKLYDVDKINESGVYSLNWDGDRNPNGLLYPDFLNSSYKYKTINIDKVSIKKLQKVTPKLYTGSVLWNIKLVS